MKGQSNKQKQAALLKELMKQDEENGMYQTPQTIKTMTAKDFLQKKGWYAGSLVLTKTNGNGLVTITEAMEAYANQKVKEALEEEKRYNIDFDGHLLTGISVKNNDIRVFGAMNGRGNGINIDQIKISLIPKDK